MMRERWYYCAAIAIKVITAAEATALALVKYYKQNLRLMDRLMSVFLPDSEEESGYAKTQARYLYGQKKQGGTTNEGTR